MKTKTKAADHKVQIYVAPDVRAPYAQFKTKYPHAGDSAVINAALRFYLAYAKDGVDGNLQPYRVDAVVNEYETRRRVVWTDEQRRAFQAKT